MAWTAAMVVPARQAMLDRLDAGAGAARFEVYDAAGALLATLPLATPAGTLDAGTGVVTLSPGADSVVVATGDPVSATLKDGDGIVLNESIEVALGTAPAPGRLVLSATRIVMGGTVRIAAASIA